MDHDIDKPDEKLMVRGLRTLTMCDPRPARSSFCQALERHAAKIRYKFPEEHWKLEHCEGCETHQSNCKMTR